MFVLFFFFKQKTAYEMRISDWSSDVCSSDLMLRRPHLMLTHFGRDVSVAILGQLIEPLDGILRFDNVLALIIGKRLARTPRLDQIGRASCRERVCQYV